MGGSNLVRELRRELSFPSPHAMVAGRMGVLLGECTWFLYTSFWKNAVVKKKKRSIFTRSLVRLFRGGGPCCFGDTNMTY